MCQIISNGGFDLKGGVPSLISIIIPVYRVEPYLHKCIDSVLSQTYKDIEVLIIDDGSPDQCGKICDEYAMNDSRVVVLHTANNGLAAARNIGLNKARGEYIGFVDSDDWIEPDMYEVMIQSLEKTGANVCECDIYSDNYSMFSDCSLCKNNEFIIYNKNEALEALIDGKIKNVTWNKLYKRHTFESLSFPIGRNYEDVAIMHHIIGKADKYVQIDARKYHYRNRTDSISQTRNAKNLFDYVTACINRYWYLRTEYPRIYADKENDILQIVAMGICRIWRWWYGCNAEDKEYYNVKIKELLRFSKRKIPLFGCYSWPFWLRIGKRSIASTL